VGTGFNQELTGRENIYLNGAILGMKRREIERRFDDIIEFSGVERFIDTPVKRYSSGMYVRLAFAVAAHFEPEILLVDEVLAVGDAEFQARCLGRMEDLGDTGRTVLFVSHNMQAVSQLCDRAVLLEGGRLVRQGPSEEIVAHYLQTSVGSGSSQTWSEEEAPGDDLVRLRSVRIVDTEGETVDYVDVRSPVGIELGFRVLKRGGPPVVPKIKVTTGGRVAFNAMDVDPRWHGESPPGDYVATAWIPGNLLNEGLVGVDAAVCSIDSPKLHHHVSVHEAVSFHVQDPAEGDSSRGTFSGQWRGVVRPLLEWTVR
jgi:lipopolysaccharide transport system ATP-binding protein